MMKSCFFGLLFVISIIFPVFANDPMVDFTKGQGQNVHEWLQEKNFILERSADDPSKTKLSLTKRGIELEALGPAQSMVAFKKGHIENYQDIEIVWGVDKFPKDASYIKGNRNEAIMVYAFFGKESIDSGSFIVPDSPYFIALQLCENDPVNTPMEGQFYHKGGRFVCVAHPKPGEVVTTRYNLKKGFEDIFGMKAPSLYAIVLEFDTRGAGDGTASAFVQSIHIPHAEYSEVD